MVKVHNQHAQAHTIMVKDAKTGKSVTRHIPANGFLMVAENELSQDIHDKNRRGIVRLLHVVPKKSETTAPAKEKAKTPQPAVEAQKKSA